MLFKSEDNFIFIIRRLDFLKAYMSKRHYQDHLYQSKKWLKEWGKKRGQVSV